jgi:hypothetical protein
MQYFRILTDDVRFHDRWFLDEPLGNGGEQIDAREFCRGYPYLGDVPTAVPIQQIGRKVGFNLAAFDMPVVSDGIVGLAKAIAPTEFECFPVKIGTSTCGYSILNTICRIPCVDESRSIVTRWKQEDSRPDRIGKYRMVSNLTIDARRTHDAHIFRVEDFEIALIVSEKIKQALEETRDLGIVFKPVC